MKNYRALLRVALGMVLAAGCVGYIGGAAHAQSIFPVQKPFSFKLGFRSPVEGNEQYFYAGASFAYAKSNAPISAVGYALYQFYVDYAARRVSLSHTQQFGSSGSRYDERSVGIGPAVAYHFGPAIAPLHPFVGAGAGYYSVKVYDASAVGRLGGKVFLGLELKSGFLGEVDYTAIGKVGDKKAGGLGVRLGYRF